MRKIKEILRLCWGLGMSVRQVARSTGVAASTVSDLLYRAKASNLGWPLPEALDNQALEALLYPPPAPSSARRPPLDLAWVHQELSRHKGVTLQLLWIEYKQQHPGGYQYTQFCEHYRRWRKRLDVVMRQVHVAGEKMFVDFAGQTVPIVDSRSGEVSQGQVFVAVLGASNYVYAEVCPSQELEHWLGAHVRALEHFGGVPRVLVPDNLKSGVSRACRYEPDMNPAYHELAEHYGAVVIPARVGRPRDKAKVEAGVLVVERSVLAALRHRRFLSLAEAQAAIAQATSELNSKPFQRLPGSRLSRFETLDKPALMPLPQTSYEFGTWLKRRVLEDYHPEIDGNHYSVPAELYGRVVEARVTARTIEVFFGGRRVASHIRRPGTGQVITNPRHQPAAHRKYGEWSIDQANAWAAGIGPEMAAFVTQLIGSKNHPEQARRACYGVVRLGRAYDRERLESAAQRALGIGAVSYRSLETILRNRLDGVGAQRPEPVGVGTHSNIRGPEYYRTAEVATC